MVIIVCGDDVSAGVVVFVWVPFVKKNRFFG